MTITLTGPRVTLRPFLGAELDRVLEVRRRPTDATYVGPPADPEMLRRRIADSGSWSDDGQVGLVFAIEAEGRLIGEVQARSPRGVLPPGVFELGIELYEAGDRGRGLGAGAIAQITSHLFAREGAHRVQLSTDVANAPMRRVAERLGFELEGVLRGFMPTASGPRDYAMYGLTRPLFEERAPTWT